MQADVKKETVTLSNIKAAAFRLKQVVKETPLTESIRLNERFGAQILLKREDLQTVRSYKIRGAYNMISQLDNDQKKNGVVCASAGNHAQGVAMSCAQLGIKAAIFMPEPTPGQKVNQVKMFGKDNVELFLKGDTFDDAYKQAKEYCEENKMAFIPPFDHKEIIEGQGTIGLEILQDSPGEIDYLLVPVGGGGLAAGITTVFKTLSPGTTIIGVEPHGAPSLSKSLDQNKVVTLDKIDKFVDGAAVQRIGDLNFEILKDNIDRVLTVPEGKICSTILGLYNDDAIIVEPAGALTVAALDQIKDEIKGKTVVSVISGSNNDITRTEEIKERALLYEGLMHYFIVRFPQRAGALREFLTNVLGPGDDIVHFEYSKKNNREQGPALVGLELKNSDDFQGLLNRMDSHNITYEYLNEKQDLFQYLI
ncbi:threonine ammonia-lyase [Mangrovivirga sp. M17]|uniref:L-threonine dehydratase n=1 Tax=Mangrovivirga halotolerans TaxID=2993936 RepID=A0ABT3RP56_9BACT|nr:threonine ammonia-lyase [Mangrovivirga halotolerans]MCX2743128.1 threonine ammonia-lyase [Mangrovivirga halotolerans]